MLKKILVGFLIVIATLFFAGCGRKAEVQYYSGDVAFGQFIVITSQNYRDPWGSNHSQYLAYDKDTKIIYLFDVNHSVYQGGISICPYYCMDINNNPVIAVYDDSDVEVDLSWLRLE